MATKRGLTVRQEWFCRYYVAIGKLPGRKGRRAVMAAKRAGYNTNSKTIHVTIYRTLRLPHIQARIQELQKEEIREAKVETQMILSQLMKFAERDPTGNSGNDRNTIQALKELGVMAGMYTAKGRDSNEENEEKGVPLKDVIKTMPVMLQKQILQRMREAQEEKVDEKIAETTVTDGLAIARTNRRPRSKTG